MKLTCTACGTQISFPRELTASPDARVECPGCHARYRLKPRERPSRPPDLTRATEIPRPAATTAPPRADLDDGEDQGRGQVTTPLPRPPMGGAAFVPGDILAGRYRIVRFLAQGGMGAVYEAEDLELHEVVALKTIGAHTVLGASAVERFKREIHLARKVTHPNVCRIFDLGQHRASLDAEPVTFLTMELLRGETLASRLDREGRLSTLAALPVAEQIAAALDAAHRAQVVHRDLKCDNVFVVEEFDGFRAVVTDFGIARGGDDRFAATVTGAGIVGTPAYMAPEQVQGEPVTPAADVYAFGIVLYEMVTGHLPFESDNPLTTAVKRLQEPPPPPRLHVPDLDPHWEKAILRCLERDPLRRYEKASDAVAELRGAAPDERETPRAEPPAAVPAAAPAPGAKRQRRLLAVLAAVALVSAGLYVYNLLRREAEPPRLVPRRSVAVLGFTNQTQRPEIDWMSTALTEMLSTELARGGDLRTIPGERVAQARREIGAQRLDDLAGENLARVHALLGCDFVVLGSYVAVPAGDGEQIRLDARLEDAALGQSLARVAHEAASAELFDMVRAVGSDLRGELGLGAAGDEALAGLPEDAEAARLYAESLDRLRDLDPAGARDRLLQAIRAEPDNPLLHSALSSAWEALGFGSRAAEEAGRAFELSSRLPREDRLAIEGRFREVGGDWDDAATTYGELWSLFPDNLEYGLRAVSAAANARRTDDAATVLEQLRRLPPPSSEDPRIDLAEATLAGVLGDFQRQLDAAGRAAANAERTGATLLLAQARLAQSQAQRFLGQSRAAVDSARAAGELYRNLDHPVGLALALTTQANAHYDLAELDEAVDLYRRALEGYRQVGDQGGTASTLNNQALALKKRGDLDRAGELYREAEQIQVAVADKLGQANTINNLGALLVARGELAAARQELERARAVWQEVGDRSGTAYALNNIAVVLRLQGELEASRAMHEEALALRRELGQKVGEVASLANLGGVLVDLGQLPRAEELLTESQALARDMGHRSAEAQALFELGELRRAQGRLDEAHEAHQQALELRRELGERTTETESEIGLARVELFRHQEPAAETEARAALAACERDGRRAEGALAGAVLARVLLQQGREVEARQTIDTALVQSTGTEQLAIRIEVELAAARIEAAEGSVARARERLDRALAAAVGAGYSGLRADIEGLRAEIGAGGAS